MEPQKRNDSPRDASRAQTPRPPYTRTTNNTNTSAQNRRPHFARRGPAPLAPSSTTRPATSSARPHTTSRPPASQSTYTRSAAPAHAAGTGATSRTNTPGGGSRRASFQRRPQMPKEVIDRNERRVTRKTSGILTPTAGTIRIIPLGGVEEIGRNMTAIEIGNDIIIIDAGLQMKTEETPGIDYIIPNTTYLEERKSKIRAMIVTHGHLDHIGGIPYVMDRIGNPPVYSRYLTTIMIQKRHEEFPHLPKLKIEIIEKDMRITIGDMKVRFFGVTHTIPDAMGVIVETPYGNIVTPGDFKLNHTDEVVSDEEEAEFAIFDKEKTLLLLAESTNIENPGFSTPEHLVYVGLEEIIRRATGRLFIGMFASHMERMIRVIEVAEKMGKKVVIDGRSMKNNVEVLKIVNRLQVKKDTLIGVEDMDKFPPNRIVSLVTGAQGDEFGVLMRLANKTHRQLRLQKGDTIVLSASIIPGNEKAVERLKDNLSRQGAKIVSYRTSDVYVHSTGHGNLGEIEWLHKKIKPKFFIPIHGNHYRLQLHKDLALSLGMPEENIVVPDNGNIIEIQDGGTKIVTLKDKAPSSPYMVDGFAIGDEQEVVIRDRQMLSQDGMFVVVAMVDSASGKLIKSPDLISRGFVYLKENQELLRQARIIIKKTIEDNVKGLHPANYDVVKNAVSDATSKYLFQKTAKRPLVIPVILSV